uniref:Disease resistance N-terminal domain-containing protein n=1 Tax=Cucumis sativus TaxID=3659 RepID=A0A0A0K6I1_CUCSA
MALEGILSGVGVEILKKLSSHALECLGMVCGLNDDLNKLRSNVSSIQSVLRDAEQRQIKGNDHSLTDWLEKLGDVFYDVEDVLDEISTEALRREVMTRGKNAKQSRKLMRGLMLFPKKKISFSSMELLILGYKMFYLIQLGWKGILTHL